MSGVRDIAFCSNLQTGKKRIADCIVCTGADVEGHTTRGRQAFRQLVGDLACLVVNRTMTHGSVNGRHVSSIIWFKTYVVGRSRPRDLRAGAKTWQRAANRHATICYLLYIWQGMYISLNMRVVWAATGPGLSHNPWSRVI
jgi:hypothetical protein